MSLTLIRKEMSVVFSAAKTNNTVGNPGALIDLHEQAV